MLDGISKFYQELSDPSVKLRVLISSEFLAIRPFYKADQ